MSRLQSLITAVSLIGLLATGIAAFETDPVRHIVVAHGTFADGSDRKPVAEILPKDGYTVSVVHEPKTLLADEVAATNRVLDRQSGTAVLVGHSYGGAVIIEAVNPDAGKSINPTSDGYLLIDSAQVSKNIAANMPLGLVQFIAISQVPLNAKVFATPITMPAWNTKPTFGIVAAHDRMINPDLEHSIYKRAHGQVSATRANHALFLSKPNAVATGMEEAATSAK